ncbi:hydrogenase maturation factor [Bradyrhizobium sp. JR3.5]
MWFRPLFFPGGNIGSLAVHGTINGVVMSGARTPYLSASFIIEEGFRFSASLWAILPNWQTARSLRSSTRLDFGC